MKNFLPDIIEFIKALKALI